MTGSLPAELMEDSNSSYEDVLCTQVDFGDVFDAHTQRESDLHMEQQETSASTATQGSSHRSADDGGFIDIGNANAGVDSHGDSGSSLPSINVEEPTVSIKQESQDHETVQANMEKITIDLSASDEENIVVVGQIVENVVKDEDLDFSWHDMGDETIEISEDEGTDLPRVNKPLFFSTDTEGNALASSDFGEPQQRSTATPIFAEPTPNIENPSLYRSVSGAIPDDSLFSKLQTDYTAKNRGEPIMTGTESIIEGFQGVLSQHESSSKADDEYETAWQDGKVEEDERNAATNFHKLRKAYRAKRKAGENNVGDDIRYLAAEKKEKVRLRRLEVECLRSRDPQVSDDSDQAAKSDDDLFLPIFPTNSTATKRTRDPIAQAQNEQREPLNKAADDSPSLKRQATKAKRELAKELDYELQQNRLAGVDQIIIAQEQKDAKAKAAREFQERKRRQEQANPFTRAVSKKSITAKGTASKPARKVRSSNATKQRRLDDLRNLGHHNIYDEANENAGKSLGPVDPATRTVDALKGLIASTPLEDLRAVRRERADIIRASKIFGHGAVHPDGNEAWEVKGLISHLRHYQLQGAKMMYDLETSLDKPHGGVMADQMGLGKTVMTLAAMVANRPSTGDCPKTTLIVAPPALIEQWMEEIEKHVKPNVFPGVIKHHTLSKLAGSGALYMMQKADVVLTTYNEVMNSYPKFSPPEELKTLEEQLSWWDEVWENHRGPLHRIHFHRIVLDEAHGIKNYISKTSVTCRALMGKHRWAITGTPIHNRVQELFPYFRFLRLDHTRSLDEFQHYFCNPEDANCTDRLHAVLKKFLIRRTHATTLLGKPLIQLPQNHQRTIYLEFNTFERAIYDMIYERYIKGINYLSNQGKLEEQHGLVLTMLMNLRRLTAHPFLIQETIERFQASEITKLLTTSDEGDEGDTRGRNMASAMQRMIEATNKPSDAVEDLPDAVDSDLSQQPLVLKFGKLLRDLERGRKWADLRERRFCQKCESPPVRPRVTSCLHLYCTECMEALADEAVINDEVESTCITCAEVFVESSECDGLKELEFVEPLLGPGDRPHKRGKKDRNADTKWIDVGGDLLPSSKTAAVEAQLEQWLTEEPDKKIIVFSQFLMLMKIVGRVCEQRKWGHCHYNGEISQPTRKENLKKFESHSNIKVLIASLKCGGVGLNLTMASKVICVDLWYNSAIEQQAFCRVFRIGQENETYITRFVVKDTIDERLERLQEEKDTAISAAIDEKMLGKLSVTKLMKLFGPLKLDNGKLQIASIEDQAGGYIEPALNVDGPEVRPGTKKNKKTKRVGTKDTKAAKVTKVTKGGKGSRGGKGAKIAQTRRDKATLERIERGMQ